MQESKRIRKTPACFLEFLLYSVLAIFRNQLSTQERKKRNTHELLLLFFFANFLTVFLAFIIDFSFAFIRYFCGFIKFTLLPPFICHS